MNRLCVAVLLALAVGLAGAGCTKQETATDHSAGKVLARVNNTTITEGDLTFWMGGAHAQTITQDIQAKMLERLIDLELLYQKGLELGLDKDPQYQERRAQVKEQAKVFERIQIKRLMVNKVITPQVKVTDEMAREYFEAHRSEIQTAWHLYALRFPTEEEALAALAEIRAGASFEAVAERVTTTKPEGKRRPPWDDGFVPWVHLPPESREVVSKLKPDQISEVVRSRSAGIRIVKLVGTRPNPRADFDAVEDVIREQLREQELLAAMDAYVAQLRTEAKIERFPAGQ